MIASSSRFSIDCRSLWIYSAPKVNTKVHPDGKIRKPIFLLSEILKGETNQRFVKNGYPINYGLLNYG